MLFLIFKILISLILDRERTKILGTYIYLDPNRTVRRLRSLNPDGWITINSIQSSPLTRSQSTPPRTSERTYGGSSPISYFSRPRSRYSDQSMLRNIRYDWGNTSNAFQRQSNTRERRLYFQNNTSRQGTFDVSYNRSVFYSYRKRSSIFCFAFG